ncbi:SOSS complex subunit C [Galemys pyrenaicus]|uniref:SOSS complex subunit C n=1 Tax=Galemys pyrenaicus TaxID=202257 RepID=A0A8J5ZVN8_GALPY|nr:SOSS complex subunit C [Galemys pyrenaicus]
MGMRKWAHLSWDTGLNGQRHEDARTVRTDRQHQQQKEKKQPRGAACISHEPFGLPLLDRKVVSALRWQLKYESRWAPASGPGGGRDFRSSAVHQSGGGSAAGAGSGRAPFESAIRQRGGPGRSRVAGFQNKNRVAILAELDKEKRKLLMQNQSSTNHPGARPSLNKDFRDHAEQQHIAAQQKAALQMSVSGEELTEVQQEHEVRSRRKGARRQARKPEGRSGVQRGRGQAAVWTGLDHCCDFCLAREDRADPSKVFGNLSATDATTIGSSQRLGALQYCTSTAAPVKKTGVCARGSFLITEPISSSSRRKTSNSDYAGAEEPQAKHSSSCWEVKTFMKSWAGPGELHSVSQMLKIKAAAPGSLKGERPYRVTVMGMQVRGAESKSAFCSSGKGLPSFRSHAVSVLQAQGPCGTPDLDIAGRSGLSVPCSQASPVSGPHLTLRVRIQGRKPRGRFSDPGRRVPATRHAWRTAGVDRRCLPLPLTAGGRKGLTAFVYLTPDHSSRKGAEINLYDFPDLPSAREAESKEIKFMPVMRALAWLTGSAIFQGVGCVTD